MTKDYNHPLYGRRVLHIMSPVRWSGSKFKHHGDSNYKVMVKTIKFLPMCHHTILVPTNNTIPDLGPNVTLVPFDYTQSVLSNRAYFNGKLLNKLTDWRGQDFDFIFNHQPELLYNVVNSIMSSRYGLTVECFNFFHWVDCPKSRVTDGYPEGFYRQLEAINWSYKSYFHCPVSKDYMKSNWNKRDYIVQGINDEVMDEKINYFPLGVGQFPDSEPFPNPARGKKILLFNHRWNNSTGIDKLVEYTEDLDRDEWLVWVTDENAKKPQSGKPAPKWMYVKNLPSGGAYRNLIEQSHATLCFVDNYMTWNLSVQDAIRLNKPSLAFKHPTHEYVLGKDYPLYFSNKDEFLDVINKIPEGKKFDWELPPHDEDFKNNLVGDLIHCLENSKKKHTSKTKYGVEWLYHILQGNGYKRNILYNSHPSLHKSNAWEGIRQWCLERGVKDSPNEVYTKLWIPEENIDDVKKIIDEAGNVDYKGDPLDESKRDPKWSQNFTSNKFF
jgi:hypothetical protein